MLGNCCHCLFIEHQHWASQTQSLELNKKRLYYVTQNATTSLSLHSVWNGLPVGHIVDPSNPIMYNLKTQICMIFMWTSFIIIHLMPPCIQSMPFIFFFSGLSRSWWSRGAASVAHGKDKEIIKTIPFFSPPLIFAETAFKSSKRISGKDTYFWEPSLLICVYA